MEVQQTRQYQGLAGVGGACAVVLMGAGALFTAVSSLRLAGALVGKGSLALGRGTIYVLGGGATTIGAWLLSRQVAHFAGKRFKEHDISRPGTFSGPLLKEDLHWITSKLVYVALGFAAINAARLGAAQLGHGTLPLRDGLIYIGGGTASALALGLTSRALRPYQPTRLPKIERM